MNKRYFFRGLGFGLIIGAIVMMVATYTQDKNKASTATPSDATPTVSTGSIESDPEISELATEITTEITTEEPTEVATEPEEKATTEKATESATERPTEAETEAATEATTEVQKGGSLTVTSGMSAQSVAKKLHEIGMIDDEEDFYMYMYDNGYASKILQGTFTFTGDEDYEGIAKILTNKR